MITKPTRQNAQKFIEYKKAEANYKKTISSKSIPEQRELIAQFNMRWWSAN